MESAFTRIYRITPLHSEPDCLFAWNRFRYSGPLLRLSDGTQVERHCDCLELHFRREAFLPLSGSADPALLALDLLRRVNRELPLLAEALQKRPEFSTIRAVHALTQFHRGIGRYGFDVLPVHSSAEERWFTFWQSLILMRDHPSGQAAAARLVEGRVVRHVWAGRDALIQRYAASQWAGIGSSRGSCGST